MADVREFFQKPLKRYCPSGKKRESLKGHRFRACIAGALLLVANAAGMTAGAQVRTDAQTNGRQAVLNEAFTRHSISEQGDTLLSYKVWGKASEALRVQGMVDKLMQTPTGAEVMKHVRDSECVICMMPSIAGKLGVFMPELNALALNAQAPDSVLVSTLVHEGTHARQVHSSGYDLNYKLDLASVFTLGRAMEADATKNQVFAAYELAERGDSSAWNAVQRDCAFPAKAFIGAVKQNPADKQAVERATFLGYFNDRDYIQKYEVAYSSGYIAACRDTPAEDLNTLGTVSLSVDSIAAKICVSDGKQYVPVEALTDSTVYYVDDYIRQNTEYTSDFLAKRKKEADPSLKDEDIKRDASFDRMYVLKFMGGYEKPKISLENQTAAGASLSSGRETQSVRSSVAHGIPMLGRFSGLKNGR